MKDQAAIHELRYLRGVVAISAAYERREEERRRMLAYLDQRITEAQPLTTYAFLQEPDGYWRIGIPGSTRLLLPARPLAGLTIAHEVFSTPRRMVKPQHSPNAMRNALGRAADWVESRAECEPLADAIRAINVTQCGLHYQDPGLIKIAT